MGDVYVAKINTNKVVVGMEQGAVRDHRLRRVHLRSGDSSLHGTTFRRR